MVEFIATTMRQRKRPVGPRLRTGGFFGQGIIAELDVHWDIGDNGMPKPNAHVMLAMSSEDESGFGPKVRDWNRTEMMERGRKRMDARTAPFCYAMR